MPIKGLNLLTNKFFSSRTSMTCTYKCGNACLGECDNKSDNTYFGDLMSRRSALKAGGLTVVTVGGSAALAACSSAEEASSNAGSSSSSAGSSAKSSSAAPVEAPEGMKFPVVEPNTEDKVVIPEGYEQSVLIAWGDPVIEGAPEFDINNQTAEAAEKQFGFNNDFAGLFEHPDNPDRMVYVCNHEYTTEPHMFPNYDADNPTEEQVKIGLANHGHTILEVTKDPKTGKLTRAFGPLNRRITGNTPFKITGPAAGHELLKTSYDPTGTIVHGTLSNCAGGVTPWGTYLSGEENYDSYWTNAGKLEGRNKEYAERMGVEEEGQTTRGWELFEDRFDMAKEPNEFNRFGYIVEVNPFDPNSTPVKHSALGRFKHEAGNVHVTQDGTVVAYSGDDARFEYIYKFVSDKKVKEGDVAHNMTILDSGTLYVGKLEGNSPAEEIDGSGEVPEDGKFDGKGSWIPLATAKEDGTAESHVEGMDGAEVFLFTRLAADKVGATKMDRPEDFEVNPVNEKVYVALTNNSYRGATGENAKKSKEDVKEYAPMRENKNGLVMEIDDDFAGTEFTWNLLLVCGDPDEAYSYFGGFDKSKVSPISCPDNVAFDSHGNLWISTDGNALDSHDGLYAVAVEGEQRGLTKCFLTVPNDAETCGPIVDDKRVLVCVQHPGEDDDATVENPTSHWPDGGNKPPRPGVAVVWKADGGKIGS
ncbi:PhoX family protein [Corynebacterium tapiri]|uniref:PhoX family phosphatase n=1 Tax=Corynebacterium tapiri TaxID=1448266 RepID=A0A5C4U230_9CORY|nr:PhoX family phosphatase [Corynebacterium tapiri]TNL96044.1 PhoX family phosphatase [Corynebacterium tapiri]